MRVEVEYTCPSVQGVECMTTRPPLETGRRAFARHAWQEAYEHLSAADREAKALDAEDLEKLATSAFLTGLDEESTEVWTRAHQGFIEQGEVGRALRAAFWLASGLLTRGEPERGSGWLQRAHRLLDDEGVDCVEAGYLLLPEGIRAVGVGEPERAEAAFARAAAIGARFADRDLVVVARHGRGRALIRQGKIEEGLALLDEAMAAVEAGEVSPMIAGEVYCSVIEACREIYDLKRAHAWTDALTDWCESQPDLVPYRGPCLVRRAELMQLHGAWSDALSEAERAGEWLARPPGRPAAADAFYRQAELHRLRGEFDLAEAAYRETARWSRKPRPGLALLRQAQGRLDAAQATIRRVLEETREMSDRSVVLPAYVEVMLAAGDVDAAHAGAEDLKAIADQIDAPMPRALAEGAEGAVLLARGDVRAGLERLRTAWARWEDLRAPYEAARVRVLIALACRRMGDEDGALIELDAARWALEQLGAKPDVERVARLASVDPASGDEHGLTGRELEVLRLVASGGTNRAIAERLSISERTVERHVSNIFHKLQVSSRTAATAHAYEHGLV